MLKFARRCCELIDMRLNPYYFAVAGVTAIACAGGPSPEPPSAAPTINLARLPGTQVEGPSDPRRFYALPNAFDAGTTRINDLAYTTWTGESDYGACLWARVLLPRPVTLERVRFHMKWPLEDVVVSVVAGRRPLGRRAPIARRRIRAGESAKDFDLTPEVPLADVDEVLVSFRGPPYPVHTFRINVEEIEVLGTADGEDGAVATTPSAVTLARELLVCPAEPPTAIVMASLELDRDQLLFRPWFPLDWRVSLSAASTPGLFEERDFASLRSRSELRCETYECQISVRTDLDPVYSQASYHVISVDHHASVVPARMQVAGSFSLATGGEVSVPSVDGRLEVPTPWSDFDEFGAYILQTARPLAVELKSPAPGTLTLEASRLVLQETGGARFVEPISDRGSDLDGVVGVERAAQVIVDGKLRYLLVHWMTAPNAFCMRHAELFEVAEGLRSIDVDMRDCDI